jgi:catechol 2,3-dioxygenase-like lactoylglutathione lyase family enzyme
MHIESVAILVNDYDAAIAFFVDALRFELLEDAPSVTSDGRPKRWVAVRPPGASTAVLLAQADGDEQSASVGRQTAGRVGFFLRVDDFHESYRHMLQHGVRFLTEPRVESYGTCAVFLDLSGNRWDLLG